MKKLEIMNSFNNAFRKVTNKVEKYSPEILAVVGVVGVTVGVVSACKATTKLSEVLEDSKENVDKIHEAMNNEALIESGKYTKEDGKKDLTIVYTQTGIKLAKLYAPSVIITTLAVGCLLKSNDILRKRNAALMAAYTAVDKGFKEYRERVVERFGDEVDRQLKYNIKAQEIEETVIDEKGKEKTVKKTIDVCEVDDYSQYAKIFDDTNVYFEKDPELNMMFLKSRQIYANQQLMVKKRLFLNEVYEMLGFEPTKAGQVIGWVYDPENPNCNNFVDFGMFNINRKSSKDFVNGYERAVILDFNVDGNVWETM